MTLSGSADNSDFPNHNDIKMIIKVRKKISSIPFLSFLLTQFLATARYIEYLKEYDKFKAGLRSRLVSMAHLLNIASSGMKFRRISVEQGLISTGQHVSDTGNLALLLGIWLHLP